MNTQNKASAEAEIHYPLGDALPEVGSSVEIVPGVR